MSEGHDAIQALRISTDGHLLTFSHPGAANQVYSIEWNKNIQKFLQNTLRRTRDVSKVFDLLHMYYEEGEGQHPHDHVGINFDSGKSSFPTTMAEGANPIVAALNLHAEGNFVRMTSPDGSTGMLVPMSQSLRKAINSYVTSPDARNNTQAAAERLFQMMGQKVKGVEAADPEQVQAAGQQSYSRAVGGDIDTSGMSMQPMESKGHKTADGEMNKPAIKSASPAKSAKVRTKQNDEPKNKGNSGSSKEEKGQPKQQFTVSPKDYKGGENEHKSMKKMHENNIKELESLLGRRLNGVREAYGDRDSDVYIPGHSDFQQQKKPRTLKRLMSFLDKVIQPEGFGEKPFAAGNPRLSVTGDNVTLDTSHGGDGNSPKGMAASNHPVAGQLSKAGFRVQQGDNPALLMISVDG